MEKLNSMYLLLHECKISTEVIQPLRSQPYFALLFLWKLGKSMEHFLSNCFARPKTKDSQYLLLSGLSERFRKKHNNFQNCGN